MGRCPVSTKPMLSYGQSVPGTTSGTTGLFIGSLVRSRTRGLHGPAPLAPLYKGGAVARRPRFRPESSVGSLPVNPC
jgi:hypothetical protein